MMNQIQYAFSRINNLPPMIKSVLQKNLKSRAGRKDWDAKLSFKTFHALKNKGVMA